ncbi:MAG: T9SS type A sorting domain-containing protein [Bacteroidota bacterium]
MKKKLLFICLLILTGNAIYAKDIIFDPIVDMGPDVTVCPGNTAVITINGTPNYAATISNSNTSNLMTVFIGASGTLVFQTPILNQTTTYSIISLREVSTGNTTTVTDVNITINVVPNGCATVLTTISPGENSMICNPGECRTLTASITPVPSTTSYSVSSIPYCPQAAFTDPSYTQINATNDDVWSPSITLPFSFSFFDQAYTNCQVGSNGLISFDAHPSPGFCEWDLNGLNIPNPAFINKNAIFGVFQDIDLRTAGAQSPADVSINWKLTGTYPCRKLIVNFYHVGQYQCNQTVGLQTTQIVLYEISNIIEVYVQNRTQCTAWENGAGVIGILNSSGTVGYVPPGRNTNDAWTASNEAWRFTPNGPNVSMFVRWLQGGNEIATGLTATVCPFETTSYVVEAIYSLSGVPHTITGVSEVLVAPADPTQNPADLSVCNDESGIYTVDLTTNNATIMGAVSPDDYEISYYTSEVDAQNMANPITNPQAFSFTQNQTIYASIMSYSYACIYVKPFQLIINALVDAPSGISPQSLNPGQTLSSLIVSGQNIQWYDAPQGGNLLPNDTVAEDNITYYASQTLANCESRIAQSARLAVLVQLNLGNNEFDSSAFNFYPNPTSDILTLTSKLADVKLDVFNTLSQKIESRILENGGNTISLSNLSSGIYLFQLSLDGKTKIYKIVKN